MLNRWPNSQIRSLQIASKGFGTLKRLIQVGADQRGVPEYREVLVYEGNFSLVATDATIRRCVVAHMCNERPNRDITLRRSIADLARNLRMEGK